LASRRSTSFFRKKEKRQTIEGKTLDNARKLTQALMPEGLFYPKGGEVFEAIKDVQISYLTHFMAPYTGGDKAKILKGERVIALCITFVQVGLDNQTSCF
jgi:hypothetical protein